MQRLVAIGVRDDERSRALEAAMARAGRPEPTLIPWRDVIDDASCLARVGERGDPLRIESPGSDLEVWHALARRGGSALAVEHGEWRPGRAWFHGLCRVMAQIAAATSHLIATQRTRDLLTMTDKLACDAALRRVGAPVPETFEAPRSVHALRDELARRAMHAAYVKPRWGSSGAGVLAYRWQRGREQLVTTAQLGANGCVYNGKRLSTYTSRHDIDRVVSLVIEDGAIVQRWVPKAGAHGGPFDLRVLVVAGRIAHRVARVGRGTITNLHLGSTRVEADALLHRQGTRVPEAVFDACARAASAFDREAVIGIDVMIDPSGRPFVLECNAWGDLIRRTTIDGLDPYDVQVRTIFGDAA